MKISQGTCNGWGFRGIVDVYNLYLLQHIAIGDLLKCLKVEFSSREDEEEQWTLFEDIHNNVPYITKGNTHNHLICIALSCKIVISFKNFEIMFGGKFWEV